MTIISATEQRATGNRRRAISLFGQQQTDRHTDIQTDRHRRAGGRQAGRRLSVVMAWWLWLYVVTRRHGARVTNNQLVDGLCCRSVTWRNHGTTYNVCRRRRVYDDWRQPYGASHTLPRPTQRRRSSAIAVCVSWWYVGLHERVSNAQVLQLVDVCTGLIKHPCTWRLALSVDTLVS